MGSVRVESGASQSKGFQKMAPLGNEVDAGFYNLVHELTGAMREERAAERRVARRRTFPSGQRIAPLSGPGIPDESQFIDVSCRDLSREGFSFLLSRPPNFESLAVAFGSPPDVIYMAADVLHCRDVLVYGSGEVQPIDDLGWQINDEDLDARSAIRMVSVGCRFSQRLHK